MRMLRVLTILLAACGHEELDFELPDAAVAGMQRGAHDAMAGTGVGSGSFGEAGGSAGLSAAPANDSSAGDDPAANGSSGRTGNDSEPARRTPGYHLDPNGYPTPPGHWAASCEQMRSSIEVCGTDLDEDCDGRVDELTGLGAPCTTGCGDGVYLCNPLTNSLTCVGCSMDLPAPCGDGFVGADEQCDPNAPSEQPGVTCTLTCERPLFIRCVDAGIAHPERCDELHVCNERIGACMPVLGPRQPRCPQLRIEGSSSADQFYPMLETEEGECWVTCSESEQCPSSLSECYMGFCAVPF